MDALLSRVDRAMEAIRASSPLSDLAARLGSGVSTTGLAHAEELTRKTLRSLLLVGTLHDVPREQHGHAGLQRRLLDAMGEMDEAVLGVSGWLEQLTPDERARLEGRMKDDPELAARGIDAMDAQAVAFGIPERRRAHLRAIGAQVAFRLTRQPLATFIDEHVDNTRKVAVGRNNEVVDQTLEGTPRRGEGPASEGVISTGGKLLGISLITGVVGIPLASANFGFVLLVSAGVVGCMAGLLMLVIGALMSAVE